MSASCEKLVQDRVRYFTGRHLTAADFQMEQDYHRSHRLLHNRVFHGWGVACGLQVFPHPNVECQKDHVAVKPGIAVDCCGHEIVVCSSIASPKIPWDDRPKHGDYVLMLSLCYHEEAVEKVPVIFDGGACGNPREESSRYRDSYRLQWHWVERDELLKYGWRQTAGHHKPDHNADPPEPRDDCKDPAGHDFDQCCQIQCPEHHCVPLALVDVAHGPITEKQIDMNGRPQIRPAWRHLTHINWYNWPHGGQVPVGWLKHHPLRVSFDRLIQPARDKWGGTGVNRATFSVRYAGRNEIMQVVHSHAGPVLEANGHVAAYGIDEAEETLGDVVFVTIRCDMILDCHGEPVDGNHLKGLVPTGDGIAGGVFESWFSVPK